MKASAFETVGLRVRLRDFRLDDVASFQFWQKPGHEWQKLDGPYYQSSTDESENLGKALAARIAASDFPVPRMRQVIADKMTDEIVGTVSSYWESEETNWLCIGLTIYDPKFWGQGIGYEALALWIEYLFSQRREIVRLDMRTWSGNKGLMALARKLGFSQEACFRKARIVNGEYFDGLGYGILREEWAARKLL